METGPLILIFILIVILCFLVYDILPNKYTKLEESFDGFMSKSLVRFEFERLPLHTIVYVASNTGKTCFVKHYLNLYRQDEEEHKMKIIIVCTDDNEWINPDTGEPYDGINVCSMDMITSE